MAYFPHISTFHSICSYKFQVFPPSFMPHKLHPLTIYACAIKKPHRTSRKVKSNDDLCNDIREFLSVVGLPKDHLPSLKELSQHGRQDLANIVRRRGYKVVKELLAVSTRTSLLTSDLEKNPSEIEEGFHDNDEDKSTGQNEKIPAPADDGSLSRSFMMMENHKSIEMDINVDLNHETYTSPEVSDVESLQKKADSFIPNGSQSPILEEEMAEVAHLKFILHQKEMELTLLKQKIEKEKHALSNLQTKAEMEISKAHQLISEKDAELQAAEESLSGLKEAEIQYLGDGEVVEVCGSFNGWHEKIKMDPEASSNAHNSAGPRKSQLWTAVLWLYPGVYEIKFVVDGHWKIDPQREFVVKGSIQNNILRVDP